MIDRQIESPMPSPSDLVVKKGSKMRCDDGRIEPRAGVLNRNLHVARLGGGDWTWSSPSGGR